MTLPEDATKPLANVSHNQAIADRQTAVATLSTATAKSVKCKFLYFFSLFFFVQLNGNNCESNILYYIAMDVAETESNKKITIKIKVEEPDIILVERMDDINCLALILNVSCVIFQIT